MISLCVPTRGRPDRFNRMLHSAKAMATHNIEVCAWFDDDDETAALYPNDWDVHYGRGPREEHMSNTWNRAWSLASGDIAMLASDDIIFETRGWDIAVEQAFAQVRDRILMVYTAGDVPRQWPILPFVSREWIDAIGELTPPNYPGWFADNFIWSIAAELKRCIFLPNVTIMHEQLKGSDQTYRDAERSRRDAGGLRGLEARFYSPGEIAVRDAHVIALLGEMTSSAAHMPSPLPNWARDSLEKNARGRA